MKVTLSSVGGGIAMPQLTRIHEIIRQNPLERDEWHLVRDPGGRRYILFETVVIDAASDLQKQCRKHEIAVRTILAQNNELSQKLRSILEV